MKRHFRLSLLILLLSFLSHSAFSQRILPNRTLIQYSVKPKGNAVELQGTLSPSHTYNKILVEREDSQSIFQVIAELPVGSTTQEYSFTYIDNNAPKGNKYYRIRLLNSVQNIQEISQIRMVRPENDTREVALYNTMVQSSNPVLVIYSQWNSEAVVQATDLSGRTITSNKVSLSEGMNNISIPSLSGKKNYLIVSIRCMDIVVTQKVVVQ